MWVYMCRYELILRPGGAIWLRIIFKALLTPKGAIKVQKIPKDLFEHIFHLQYVLEHELSDPNLTALPTHPIKYVARSRCYDKQECAERLLCFGTPSDEDAAALHLENKTSIQWGDG